jgi:hypothetical protein
MLRMSERFTPSLSRQEITGKDGEAFTPITINIPKFNLPNPNPVIEIGEGSLPDLLDQPQDRRDSRELCEGTPADNPGHVLPDGEGAITDNPQNAESSEITPPGEESSENPLSFVFLPADLAKAPPQGYKREF